MIKKILILLIFTTFSVFAADNIDSLENVLKTQNGKDKIPTLDKLARTYEPISPELRLKYSLEFIKLAKQADIDSLVANALTALSISYYYNSNLDSAIFYTELALIKYEELKDTLRTAALLLNLGVFYTNMGQTDKALEKYLQSLKIKQKRNDSLGIALAHNNIGAVYFDMSEYKKAIQSFQNALKIHNNISNYSSHPRLYLNMSKCFFELTKIDFYQNNSTQDNDYKKLLFSNDNIIDIEKLSPQGIAYFDSTRFYLMKSYDYYSRNDDEIGLAELNLYLAMIELNLNNLDKALELLNESEIILKKHNIYLELTKLKNYQGFIYYLKHNYSKSIEIINKSNDYARMNSQIDLIAVNLRLIAQNQMAIKNYKEAAFTLQELDILKDSLYFAVNRDSLLQLTHIYEVNQKSAELELAKKNEEVHRQREIILVILSILLLTLFFGLVMRFRYKSKITNELAEKNQALNQLNDNLSKSQKELQSANLSKDKLFSIIAHDLLNPLGAFRNVTQVLSNDFNNFDKKDIQEFVDIMKDSAGSLYLLLENLLTWSANQRGTITAHLSKENISQIVDLTISPLIPVAASKNIEIENLCDKNLYAIFDKNLTSTIIRNLVSNAVKFSKPDSKIVVFAKESTDNQYTVCIQDFGVGMSDEIKESLFKIDNTQSNDGTEGEKGTGLGLVICKDFAEMQGGNIWVESELGKGSTFCFTLKNS